MPDITLCTNTVCPLRPKCYRATAKPDEYWQSYAKYEPKVEFNKAEAITTCDMFKSNH